MIKLKYYPIRFEKECKEFDLEFSRDFLIKDYIDKTGIDIRGMSIIIDGKVVESLNIPIDNQSEILITPALELEAIGTFLEWAFVTHWFTTTMIILSAGFAVYQAVSAPRLSGFGSYGSGMDESSPTYGWEGIRTIQEVGVPVKVIYGEHRTGGNILNQYVSTDGDLQYLNILIGVCEGEIDSISGVQINDNPVENFSDIDTAYRLGTNDQTVIPNFEDLHNVYGINAQLLKDPGDNSKSYTYTTADSDVEGFEIYLTLPNGLFQVNSTSGAITSWDVTYQVEYKLHTDGSWTDLGTTTISGKSRSTLRRIYRKDGLTAGQYDIRITRTSDDSSLDPQMTGDLYLTSIDEIKTDDLAYPNTALYSIRALATNQLSGTTPNVTFVIKGKKVSIPDVLTEEGGDPVDWEDYYYDPVSETFKLLSDGTELYWDESSFTTAWSANPIWCLKDLLLNTRYGLGELIQSTDLDDDELLEMALYCEEKVPDGTGSYEKRFRMDVVLDSYSKAPDILTQLTAIFRAFAFQSQNGYSFRIDKAESPVQVFGVGNIVKDQFNQTWKSKNEIYNVVEVQFADKDTDYEDETVAVMDEASIEAGDPIRKKQIRLFTTRKSYALREGRYALWLSKYLHRSISLKTFIDGVACQAGDVINVSHDVPQWGYSGRVGTGSTTTKVVLDRSVVLETGKTYKVMVRFSDNTIEEKTVTDPPGTVTEVNVSAAFAQAPLEYDVYAFGESTKVIKPFRIVGISRDREGEVNINAIEYNASVYDDSAVVLPTNNYSALSLAIPSVSGLTLTERLIKMGDGSIEDAIDVWFDKPQPTGYARTIKKVHIYLSEDNLNWVYRGETVGYHYPIVGDIVDGKTYYVKVVTVTDDNKEGDLTSSPGSSISVVGKSAPPSDVTAFLVNRSRDRIYMGWTVPTDIDLSGFEIRYGESWEVGSTLVSNLKGSTFILLNFREGVDQSFWIKAIDTSGNFSTNAKEAVITIEEIPFKNIIASYSEQPSWGGTKSNTVYVTGGILEISSGQLSGTYVTPVRDVGYVASFKIGIEEVVTLAAGARRFDDDSDVTFADSQTDRFSGSELAGSSSFEIKTSEDNVTWTDWATWQAGDYYCRYFQIRMTLTRNDLSQTVQCSQLDYYADLPDVDDKMDGEVTVAGDGCDLTFTKTFHEDPYGVHITILTGDGVYAKIASLDSTGCNVKLYDAAGTAKTGTFKAHIHGV